MSEPSVVGGAAVVTSPASSTTQNVPTTDVARSEREGQRSAPIRDRRSAVCGNTEDAKRQEAVVRGPGRGLVSAPPASAVCEKTLPRPQRTSAEEDAT